MSKSPAKVIDRQDFILKLKSSGLSYVEATIAYEATVALFRDAVVNGHRVNIGKVGAIVPIMRPPRPVRMGFKRVGTKVEKVSREFILGHRIKFIFRLYRSFMRQKALNWTLSAGETEGR
jgi:hypothetical protein